MHCLGSHRNIRIHRDSDTYAERWLDDNIEVINAANQWILLEKRILMALPYNFRWQPHIKTASKNIIRRGGLQTAGEPIFASCHAKRSAIKNNSIF